MASSATAPTNDRCGCYTGTCEAIFAVVDRSSIASAPVFGLANAYVLGSGMDGTPIVFPTIACGVWLNVFQATSGSWFPPSVSRYLPSHPGPCEFVGLAV